MCSPLAINRMQTRFHQVTTIPASLSLQPGCLLCYYHGTQTNFWIQLELWLRIFAEDCCHAASSNHHAMIFSTVMPTIILLVNASVYFHLNRINMSRHISDGDKSRARGKDSAHVDYVSNNKSYSSTRKSSSRNDMNRSTLLAMTSTWTTVPTQIEHRMPIHAVNEQVEGTVLPAADVSPSTV